MKSSIRALAIGAVLSPIGLVANGAPRRTYATPSGYRPAAPPFSSDRQHARHAARQYTAVVNGFTIMQTRCASHIKLWAFSAEHRPSDVAQFNEQYALSPSRRAPAAPVGYPSAERA